MNVLVILNDPPYGTERSYVRLKTPGRRWHWAKVLLERTWFPRWLKFGRESMCRVRRGAR